nr:RNA-directed DNA polymerase, eukaryota [Tanacetum cinerariifolium]
MGVWVPTSTRLLIIYVYAPQNLTEKQTLWDYLCHIIDRWDGESVILGDFNEVRTEAERYGSRFNFQGANSFDNFISVTGLVDLPLGGYSFTWSHKSATKMSKPDKFLISEGLIERAHLVKSLNELNNLEALDIAQKAKVRWSIEGDENTKYFHGVLNNKRSQLAIRGVVVDGDWIEEPQKVKHEFYSHFADSDVQSAFVADMQILDGPFIFNELISWCKNDILNKFGFGGRWRGWVQGCFKSSMGSVLVNGSPTVEFPFQKGLFSGINIGPLLKISHLFYVDDAVFVAIHGESGLLDRNMLMSKRSLWLDIIKEVLALKRNGIDLRTYCRKKITIMNKLRHNSIDVTFRRRPRGGAECEQHSDLSSRINELELAQMQDRWYWSLMGTGIFSVKSVRNFIDDFMLVLDEVPLDG